MDNNEVLQVVVDFVTGGGHHLQNKFTYRAQFASSQADSQVMSAVGTYFSSMYNTIADWVHSALDDPWGYLDIVDYVVDHWEVVRTVGSVLIGTSFVGSGGVLPFMDAAVAVARTLRPRSRGRKFLPVFTEDAQDNTNLLVPAIADVADFVADYVDWINVGTQSDLIPGVPSTVTGTFLPFHDGFADEVLGSQRRRRPGYGI